MIPRHRPFAAYWDWQQHALCRGMDSSVFFSPPGERGTAKRAREKKARAVCGSCPVIEVCARIAMNGPESYGVWGGMSEGERSALLRPPRAPRRRRK
ncbi:WhiB family transcriptional regulator [Streptomyces prunicolor]|uniref:WhiB family transcriptional regulator n=1 Tax=Streptomyces TaxID=1883 RepID=UPI000524FAC2|nr:WhiB family transcriptional regulator [Streptomyces sp. NRRL F-525]WSV09426.1 WhiB family transcriptional regulator [Streptomyces prunicolor]